MVSYIAPFFDDGCFVVVFCRGKADHLPAFGEQKFSDLEPGDVIVEPHGDVTVTVVQHFSVAVHVIRVPTFVVAGVAHVFLE